MYQFRAAPTGRQHRPPTRRARRGEQHALAHRESPAMLRLPRSRPTRRAPTGRPGFLGGVGVPPARRDFSGRPCVKGIIPAESSWPQSQRAATRGSSGAFAATLARAASTSGSSPTTSARARPETPPQLGELFAARLLSAPSRRRDGRAAVRGNRPQAYRSNGQIRDGAFVRQAGAFPTSTCPYGERRLNRTLWTSSS